MASKSVVKWPLFRDYTGLSRGESCIGYAPPQKVKCAVAAHPMIASPEAITATGSGESRVTFCSGFSGSGFPAMAEQVASLGLQTGLKEGLAAFFCGKPS